jgi:hypothetical protein
MEMKFIGIGGAVLGVGGLITWGALADRNAALNEQVTVVTRVVNTERRCESRQVSHTDSNNNTYYTTEIECKNLVHTDAETFENHAVGWVGKSESDATRLQGMLERNRTYSFVVYGKAQWGSFRKIISAEPTQ